MWWRKSSAALPATQALVINPEVARTHRGIHTNERRWLRDAHAAKPLEAWAAAWREATGYSARRSAERVRAWFRLGALCALPEPSEVPPMVGWAVLSANRLDALKAQVDSLQPLCERLAVLVAHDGPASDQVKRIARKPIHLVTRDERAGWAKALPKSLQEVGSFLLGVDLPPPLRVPGLVSTGANRNVTLVAFRGRFVTQDDDVDSVLRRPVDDSSMPTGCLLRSGAADRLAVRYASEANAVAATTTTTESALAWHDAVIGRQLADIASRCGGLHWPAKCKQGLVTALNPEARVRMAAFGVAGRIVNTSPLAFFTGAFDSTAVPDDTVTWMQREPAIMALAPELTVTPQGHWLSAHASIDHSTPLVPFMPLGRGSDTLWGRMVAAPRADTLDAQLPFAVGHRSARAGGFANLPNLNVYPMTVRLLEEAEAWHGVATMQQTLSDAAVLPLNAFRDRVLALLQKLQQSRLEKIDSAIEAANASGHSVSQAWLDVMGEMRTTVQAWAARPEEACDGEITVEGLRLTWQLFADALDAWPELLRALPCLASRPR